MTSASQSRPRALTTAAVTVGTGVLILATATLTRGRPPEGVAAEGPGHWVIQGIAYSGDSSCSASACHGAEKPKKQSGRMIGDEHTIWSSPGTDGDPHNHSWKTLASSKSAAIAAKMKIDKAQTSDRCLSCHALNVPAAQRKDSFAIESGNSCEACHGPSEKYLAPHAKPGWTDERRETLDAAGMFKTHGLFDTSDIALRAALCVSCHLQIDKDMLDAGHPALRFEMYSYSNYQYEKRYTPHWDEPEGKLIAARLWSVGQAAALAAAQQQVQAWKANGWDTGPADALVEMYRQGVKVAKEQFGADSAAALNKATLKPEACAAAAKALAATADGAKTGLNRTVVAWGVTALTLATFEARGKEAPDELYNARKIAIKGEEGPGYLEAIKKIADLAK